MRIGLTFDYRNKGVKNAKNDIAALGKSALKATAGITSAGLAVQKLNRFLQESVRAAMDDERAQANLNRVLLNSGFAGAATQVSDYITNIQRATGVTEDQLRPAFLTLFNSLRSVTKAQETLNIALEVSAATGKDLASVTSAFGKAAVGAKTSIGRLGLGISKADLAAMSFDDIMASLERKFSGSTQTAANTFAGKMDRLRAAIGEGKETIGYALIDVFAELAGNGDIDQAIENVDNFSSAVARFIREVSGAKEPTSMFSGFFHDMATGFSKDIGQISTALKVAGSNRPGSPLNFISQLGNVAKANKDAARSFTTVYGVNNSPFTASALKNVERAAAAARAKELARQKALEQAKLARERAAEAQKKRQAQLDKDLAKTQMMYDTDRIALMKALSETQSADTKKRLNDLLLLNTATYAQALGLSTTEQMLELINAQMEKWFGKQQQIKNATIETANAYADMLSKMNAQAAAAGLGRDTFYSATGSTNEATMAAIANITEAQAANVLTSMFPELDRGAANPGAYGGTQVNVTVNGSLLAQQDLEAAIAGAVNTAARAGLSYSQVFSRL